MPTKRTTTTTTKKVEEVNPTEEIVVEETPVDVEEDFNLEKKVTVRSIAEWTTGFQRIETNGDVTIPPWKSFIHRNRRSRFSCNSLY